MIKLHKQIKPKPADKLRIVVPTPLYGGSMPVAYHAADALRDLGHEVEVLKYDQHYGLYQRCGESARDSESRHLMQGTFAVLLADLTADTAIKSAADLVWYTAQSPVSVKSLRLLRAEGIKTSFWFVEDIRRFDYWKHLVQEFDVVFTIQVGEVKEAIINAGARRVEYLPMAVNPKLHRTLQLNADDATRYGSEVSFVGAGYRNRVRLFELLRIDDLKLWGNDWPDKWQAKLQESGRRVTPEETCSIYNASRINLNIHSSVNGELLEVGDFVNPRTFEIAACGAFQIVNEQVPLSDMFDLKNELNAVRTVNELKDSIQYYSSHPLERKDMAQAAQQRVLREHTYRHRMQHALRCLGLTNVVAQKMNTLPTIADLKTAAWGDTEMQTFLSQFPDNNLARLEELVAQIPAGERDLTRAELLILLMKEFRQWGVEKAAIQ
jgi:spore maturation protein CgeB